MRLYLSISYLDNIYTRIAYLIFSKQNNFFRKALNSMMKILPIYYDKIEYLDMGHFSTCLYL